MSASTVEHGDGRVVIKGAATIDVAIQIHEALSQALSTHSTVIVDIAALERADLSFVQLLISARRTAHASGATLVIEGDHETVRAAAGCSPDLELTLEAI